MNNEEILNLIKEHFDNVNFENGSFSKEMRELIEKEMLQALKEKSNFVNNKKEQH